MRNDIPGTSWHFTNAALGTGIWFASLLISGLVMAGAIANRPHPEEQFRALSTVMTVLMLAVQFALMLLISMRSSRRTKIDALLHQIAPRPSRPRRDLFAASSQNGLQNQARGNGAVVTQPQIAAAEAESSHGGCSSSTVSRC